MKSASFISVVLFACFVTQSAQAQCSMMAAQQAANSCSAAKASCVIDEGGASGRYNILADDYMGDLWAIVNDPQSTQININIAQDYINDFLALEDDYFTAIALFNLAAATESDAAHEMLALINKPPNFCAAISLFNQAEIMYGDAESDFETLIPQFDSWESGASYFLGY